MKTRQHDRCLVAAALLTGCLAPAGTQPPPKTRIGPLSPGWHEAIVDGTKLAYEVRGRGPVCFAHPGGPGFDGSYLRLDGLDRNRTVVYIDPLGTGRSGKLGAGAKYSLARDVTAIEALRAHVGLDQICLVGHSYGGFVVQTYALDHPSHVASLILYSTSPTTTGDFMVSLAKMTKRFEREPWFADAMRGEVLERTAKTDDERLAAARPQFPLFFADWTHHADAYGRALATVKISHDVATKRDHPPFDVRSRLHAIVAPTLIIAGDTDFCCGETPSGWIRDRIPHAKYVVIPKVGHMAHIEDPQTFDRAITEFLRYADTKRQ